MVVGDLLGGCLDYIERSMIGIGRTPIEYQWFSSHVRPSRSRTVSP